MGGIVKVRVIPKAAKNKVEKFDDGLKVRLTAPAAEGKANKALIKILAAHFGVKKSQIKIISGKKSRNKLVKI